MAIARRAWGWHRVLAIPIVAMALAGLGARPALAQGAGGGPPGGGGDGGGSLRGESVPLREATEPGARDSYGGTSGGRGGSGGTVGSSFRSPLRSSPGDPNASPLGAPIGASGLANFENMPGTRGGFVGTRLSPLASELASPGRRQSGDGSGRNQSFRLRRDRLDVQPPDFDPITLAPTVRLDVPDRPEEPGPPDGLTLDAAIAMLLRQNLDLMALRYEIPKAQADLLTASLRNNPILYADAQLIPYGHYSYKHPGGSGGQPQYDVNISYPIDVSGKRRARIAVAERAKKVTEAQLQDAARSLIDDLYRGYINVLAARETLRFTEAYLAGMVQLHGQAVRERDRQRAAAERAKAEHGADSDEAQSAEDAAKAEAEAVDDLDDQVRQGRFQARRAAQILDRTHRELALMLDLPRERAGTLRLRGRLREIVPLPAPPETIVQVALASRPDLAAYRLGLSRARAEVRLARANRFSDIYLVYQPYTLQGGRAFGARGTYSYALGVNAALPLYNRNQGNIARAEWNASQTQVELASLEKKVAHEVEEEIHDFLISQAAVLEMERVVLPGSRKARDLAFDQYQQDPSKVNDYIDKQKDYNDVVQEYRNTLIDHRQSMLDLNTAVGVRILP